LSYTSRISSSLQRLTTSSRYSFGAIAEVGLLG
jgi:hypothetical protein